MTIKKTTKKRPAFIAQLCEVSRARLRGQKRKRKAEARDEAKVLEDVKWHWMRAIDDGQQ